MLAGAVGLTAKLTLGGALPPIAVLAPGVGLVFGVYGGALIAMGQKKLYLDLLTDVFRGRRAKQ